jgi:hypothetical protein
MGRPKLSFDAKKLGLGRQHDTHLSNSCHASKDEVNPIIPHSRARRYRRRGTPPRPAFSFHPKTTILETNLLGARNL